MEISDAEKCMELLKPLRCYNNENLKTISITNIQKIILTVCNESKDISDFLIHVKLLIDHGLYTNKQIKEIRYNLNIILRNDYFNLVGKYIFNYIMGYISVYISSFMYRNFSDIYPKHSVKVYLINVLRRHDFDSSLLIIYKDILESIDFDYLQLDYSEYIEDSIDNVKKAIFKFTVDLMVSSDITICKILNNYDKLIDPSNILKYFIKLYNFNLKKYLTPEKYKLYITYKSHQFYNYMMNMFIKVKFDKYINNFTRINYNEFNFDIIMDVDKIMINVHNNILTLIMGQITQKFKVYTDMEFIQSIISYIHDHIEEMYG